MGGYMCEAFGLHKAGKGARMLVQPERSSGRSSWNDLHRAAGSACVGAPLDAPPERLYECIPNQLAGLPCPGGWLTFG